MATKLQRMSELSIQTTNGLTHSIDTWLRFLDSAAWLYKYPFHEQVLIHAQRPDAKACASMELWNNTFRRWVIKGAKGIALIDDSEDKLKLRYVFDVSDTNTRYNIPFSLWQQKEQDEDQMCIDKGILYEDYRHNCCFVGKDENGMPRYATIRSSSPYHTFLMDVKGSDKAYSFQIGTPTSKKLFLFESAIDLLSYYELSANKQNNYLSVSGVYQPNKKDTAYTIPAAVTKFLTQNPHIKTIHICFDNDNAGCKAANALYKQLSPKYEAFVEPPTQGKDYNDQLLYERGLPKTFKTRITKNHNKEDLTK